MLFNIRQQQLCAGEAVLRIDVTAPPILCGIAVRGEHGGRQEQRMPHIFRGKPAEPNLIHQDNRVEVLPN
jgi:hypothetical protein